MPWHKNGMNTIPQNRMGPEALIGLVRGRINRPIVLVGPMGAGKSRLGRRLGQVLGLPFVDSDDEVERAAGMRIPEIFATLGEPAFRDGEARVIRRLLDNGAQVISTGGGAVMRPETADLIWAQSISIWVRADLAILVERTRNGRPRPLLAGKDPEQVLRDLSVIRDPVYARAMIQVDTGSGDDDAIMVQALRGLQDLLGDM